MSNFIEEIERGIASFGISFSILLHQNGEIPFNFQDTKNCLFQAMIWFISNIIVFMGVLHTMFREKYYLKYNNEYIDLPDSEINFKKRLKVKYSEIPKASFRGDGVFLHFSNKTYPIMGIRTPEESVIEIKKLIKKSGVEIIEFSYLEKHK